MVIYLKTQIKIFQIYSLDGYDEISLTNEFKLITNKEEIISDASYFKLNKVDSKKILGGKSVEELSLIHS